MRRFQWIAFAVLVSSCGDGSPTGSGTDTPGDVGSGGRADPMFSQAVLHEVRLVMDPRDWQALRDNFRENQYYAANISIDRETATQVGVRSRGDGSRDANKPGLKIDFNKFVKSQEFHGYKTLVVDNVTQDRSLVRERLALSLIHI